MTDTQDPKLNALTEILELKGPPLMLVVTKFWREPTPSDNWCPRVTELTMSWPGTEWRNTKTAVLTIPNHDWTIEALCNLIKPSHVVDQGEIELTKAHFKRYQS